MPRTHFSSLHRPINPGDSETQRHTDWLFTQLSNLGVLIVLVQLLLHRGLGVQL